LWFTNNHGRADTNGNGTSNPHFNDQLDADLSNDVGDQFFKAVPGGDYRYDNFNFRSDAAFPDTTVVSTTFDNLDSNRPGFGQLHDPLHPNGLGPSSSANGFDFVTMDLRGVMSGGRREYAVVSRWSDFVTENAPGTDNLEYRDLVVVDPSNGQVASAIRGFVNPIDVLTDPSGGFLVADFGNGPGSIYHVDVRGIVRPFLESPFLNSAGPNGVPEPTTAWTILLFGAAAACRRRRKPRGISRLSHLPPRA